MHPFRTRPLTKPEPMYTESALMFRSARKNCTMYRDTARTMPEHCQNTAGHQFPLGHRTSECKLRSVKSNKSNNYEVKVKVILKLNKCAPPATVSHRQPPPVTARTPPATANYGQPLLAERSSTNHLISRMCIGDHCEDNRTCKC